MTKTDELRAQIKGLEEKLKEVMEEEREQVLADIKEKIKQFDFKASDFKGYFKTRVTQKQVDEFLAKKKAEAAKKAK